MTERYLSDLNNAVIRYQQLQEITHDIVNFRTLKGVGQPERGKITRSLMAETIELENRIRALAKAMGEG